MRKLIFILLSFSLLLATDGLWESITPIKKIDKLVIYNNHVFGYSRGGVVQISPNMEISYYTKTDGIGGVVARDITTNDNGVLTITLANRLAFFNGKYWTASEQINLNEWNKVFATNENAWITYKEGVIVFRFSGNEWQYRDFFNQFPALVSGDIQGIEFSNKIFLFSDSSTVSAPADYLANNLKNIENWKNEFFFESGEILNSYTIYDSALYLATTDTVYRLDKNENLIELPSITAIDEVTELFSDNSGLYAFSAQRIYKYENGDWQLEESLGRDYESFVRRDNTFIMADLYSNLSLLDRSSGQIASIVLNRPLGMRFRKFAVDDKGNIFAATTGFYGGSADRAAYLYDGKWYDLRVKDAHFSYLNFGNTILSVNSTNSGDIIWATYGRGLYIQNGVTDFDLINRSGNRTAEFSINNKSYFIENDESFMDYLGYVATESDVTYVITHDMVTDSYGNVWLTNHLAHTFNSLICVKSGPGGEFSLDKNNWVYWDMRVPFSGSLLFSSIGAVEVDAFEIVWIGTRYEGLARLNYNYTLENKSDDTWRVFKTTDGLFSNQILSIGSDENATIYVGTDNGLNMISGSNVYQLKGDYAPKGTRISGIARDAKGNMWFTSDLGVSMLESNKNAFEPNSWIHFSTANSDLVADFCHGIYINDKNGKVYIGTELGISVYNSPLLVNSTNSSGELSIGPNPFRIGSGKLMVAGIGRNSGLKILTQTGLLVKDFDPSEIISGVVFWNGRNNSNEIVASGVYVLVTSNDEGKIQTAKVLTFR